MPIRHSTSRRGDMKRKALRRRETTCYVIAYDIADDRRRTKVHQILMGCGKWTQYSLFECFLAAKNWCWCDQNWPTTWLLLRIVSGSIHCVRTVSAKWKRSEGPRQPRRCCLWSELIHSSESLRTDSSTLRFSGHTTGGSTRKEDRGCPRC